MQQITTLSLIQRIEDLAAIIGESPYISREGRLALAKEMNVLLHQLNEQELSHEQVEQMLVQLYKRIVIDEIATLSSKLRLINPSSPRLDPLRSLGDELQADHISADQARQKLITLMTG